MEHPKMSVMPVRLAEALSHCGISTVAIQQGLPDINQHCATNATHTSAL